MEEARIFQILGIEACRDQEKIKAAYRERLALVHPEEDPAGFMELRQAYEAAVRLAAQTQTGETDLEADTTPSGLWSARVAGVYGRLSERRDVAKWKELLADPILMDLEQEEICYEKLLAFLMEHFRLPEAVWKLLDSRLHIADNRERLYEKFPRDFVDFCAAHSRRQGDDMAYDLFEGEDAAQYDLFIRNYFDVVSAQEAGKTEEAGRILEQADTLRIYHPYLEVSRAVQKEQEGKAEEAKELIEVLLSKYPEEETISYQAAELYFRQGEREKWAALYRQMKTKNEKHYMANFRLTEYYAQAGEYEKAKRCAEEVMHNPVGEDFQKLVQEINRHLEEALKKELEEQPADQKKRLELGWCYLQDDQEDQVCRLFDGILPEEENRREYESLMAKAAFAQKDYSKAVMHLENWLPLLEDRIAVEGETEKKEDLERVGTAHWMLSRIYREQAKQEPAGYEKALAQIELAIQASNISEVNYHYEKALVLQEMNRNQECLALCEKLLAEHRFWPAFMLKQEACEKLRDAAGVIECYRNLKSIYPAYVRNYEKAAEVYWELDRLEELNTVLEEAAENEVKSAGLALYRCKLLRVRADNRQQMEEALQYAQSLEENFKKNESKEVIAELYAACCCCEQRLGRLNDALEHIGKAIALDPKQPQYRLSKAEVLQDGGNAQKAYSIYQQCERYFTGSAYFYSHLGDCCKKLGKIEEAIEAFEKSLAFSPEQPYVYEQLVRICIGKIRETWEPSWYEKGKDYAKRLVASNEIDYNYWLTGLLQMNAGDYPEAEKSFREAIERDQNDWSYYNDLGCVYQYTERLEEAENCFRKASQLADLSENSLPMRNLGDTYERMGRLEAALTCYEELRVRYETLPEKKKDLSIIYQDLKVVFNKLGKYEEAVRCCVKSREENTPAALYEEFELALENGRFVRAEEIGKQMSRNGEYGTAKGQMDKGRLFYVQGRFLQALRQYRLAFANAAGKQEAEEQDFIMMCDRAGYCCLHLGLPEEEKEWGRRALQYMEQLEGGLERRERNLRGQKDKIYDLVIACAHAGEPERARDYLKKMREGRKCRYCTQPICVDLREAQGLLAELAGEPEKAAALYGEVYACTSLDPDVNMKFSLLSGGKEHGRKAGKETGRGAERETDRDEGQKAGRGREEASGKKAWSFGRKNRK